MVPDARLLYEIALSIGASLDLDEMLRASLPVWREALGCSAAGVILLDAGATDGRAAACLVPPEAVHSAVFRTAQDCIPQGLPARQLADWRRELPLDGESEGGHYYHVLDLPGAGVLVLTRRGAPLAVQALGALVPLAGRLATACRACVENERRSVASLEQALRESEGLFAAARAILGATRLEEICQTLTTHFNRLVQADRLVIYLVDHTRREIVQTMWDGLPAGDEHAMTYDTLLEGISGIVFKTRQPVLSASADDGIEPEAMRERRRAWGTGALIVVPLVTRGRVIGTVTAINRIDQRQFTPHDVDLLMALATQAATALDNVRLRAEMANQVRRWESIGAVSAITSAQLDEEDLFDLLYREALRLSGVPEEKASFVVARYDAEREELSFSLRREGGARVPPVTVPVDRGFHGWVVRRNRPLLVDDLAQRAEEYGYEVPAAPGEAGPGLRARACVAVPLRVGNRVTGVMSVQSLDAGVFTLEHLALLSMWSGQVGIALENAALVDALRQRAAELQARNEELDAFGHTAAHDLKNPLHLVMGFASSLETLLGQGGLSPEEAIETARAISRSAQKIDAILEELMLLAGVRRLDVKGGPLDMGRIVAEALERLAPLREVSGAQIDVPSRWPVARGHAPWIEEVWANYLNNGIRYGGDPPRLQLGAAEQGDMVRFWVRDNGPGLSPGQQADLFVPFERLSQVSTEGNGLGLSIVRRIVEKLGGQVGVDSAVGEGSAFYFTLPKA